MRYKPLRSDQNEIRFLEIQEIKNEDRPSFKLRHFSLNEAPEFLAISYAWGNHDDKVDVSINGHTFGVTRALFKILRDRVALYRHKKARKFTPFVSRYLWVDAVCINQSDFRERAQQVLIMGKIYQTACVGVCLGHNDRRLDKRAWDTIGKLHKRCMENPSELSVSDGDWEALHCLFTKPWFRRTWIIQEYLLSTPETRLIWNAHLPIDWIELLEVTKQLFGITPSGLTTSQIKAMRNGMKDYLTLIAVEAHLNTGVKPDLALRLLWHFRDRLATDPRDKIYSLVSLLQSVASKERNGEEGASDLKTIGIDLKKLIIDYEAPVEDVFASLVDAIISATGSLNILSASQYPSSFARSWIPNWADPWERHSLLIERMDPLGGEGLAHWQASGSMPASFSFSKNRATLRVRGIKVDQIVFLHDSPVFPARNGDTIYPWVSRTFKQLDLELQNRLLSRYSKQANSGDDSDDENEVSAPLAWLRAVLVTPFQGPGARGQDFRQFYQGAGTEWHSSALSYTNEEIYSDDEDEMGMSGDLEVRATQIGHRRKLFISKLGYCGNVPDCANVGDWLCVFLGCDVPVIIRNFDRDKYIFIGEGFSKGLMSGEVIKVCERGEATVEDLELI